MNISVTYTKLGGKVLGLTKENIKNQKIVYQSVIIPVRKNVWYFYVGFTQKVKTQFWGSDGEYDHLTYFHIGYEKYAVVKIDATKEKLKFNVYALDACKDYYEGIVIGSDMISNAVSKFRDKKRK
jgi:hypothetical protein